LDLGLGLKVGNKKGDVPLSLLTKKDGPSNVVPIALKSKSSIFEKKDGVQTLR